jgi:hypothetical protein
MTYRWKVQQPGKAYVEFEDGDDAVVYLSKCRTYAKMITPSGEFVAYVGTPPEKMTQRSMIFDRHPENPKFLEGVKAIGFWNHPEAPYLPYAGSYVDLVWPSTPEEVDDMARVVQYLRDGKPVASWWGSRVCPFMCHRTQNTQSLSDGTYVWPTSFAHVVEVHKVRPPDEFIEHVRTVLEAPRSGVSLGHGREAPIAI